MDGAAFEVLRPDDLLTGRIELQNLAVDGRRLVRIDSNERASLVLRLPPQHFREQPAFSTAQPIDLAAAAPSALEFILPEDSDELAIGPDGLLGVCEALGVAPTHNIFVPARVFLQPKDGQWLLGLRPHAHGGRTELWRAKLTGPVRDGTIVARFEIAAVFDDSRPTWRVLPAPGQLFPNLFHGIMEATRFDLSPIGASVRMRGPIGFGANLAIPEQTRAFINTYEHQIDYGRDTYVRVDTRGHLSSGHPATLVEVTRRVFVADADGSDTRFARLEAQRTIVIDDPVLPVDMLADAYGGPARTMPFRAFRVLTTQTPTLDETPPSGPFWVRSGGRDFPFALQGADWAGRLIDFTMPLVFIPHGVSVDQVIDLWIRTLGAGEVLNLGTKQITLVDTRGRADASATVTIDWLVMSFQPSATAAAGVPTTFNAPVLPVVDGFGLVLDAVTEFTGRREVISSSWHQAYRDHGLDTGPNPLGAFISMLTPRLLPFDPRRVGGLAKPDMQLAAVTAVRGAVPAGFELDQRPDVGTIAAQFGQAKILGLVPLTDVLALDQLAAPKLHREVSADQVALTYHWDAPIRADNPTPLKAHAVPPGQPSTLHLTAHLTRRVADGATTAHVEGRLTQVAIEFAGVVRLHFDALRFTADAGDKPRIVPTGMALEFFNELSFLQDLRSALARTGLAQATSVDVTSSRITAGFSASLPSLPLGMFTISNLSISTLLTIPFEGSPVAFSFAVAERFKPFTVTVSMFGGGGFFALELDSNGIRRIEAALEFGGAMSLDIVVASGGVFVMAGIYFLFADGKVNVSGFVRAGGHLSVLGIVTVSVDFFLQLGYQTETGKITGRASLTVGVKVLFFSKSVTLTVERTFAGSAGDPTFTDCFELEDWEDYCDAFA